MTSTVPLPLVILIHWSLLSSMTRLLPVHYMIIQLSQGVRDELNATITAWIKLSADECVRILIEPLGSLICPLEVTDKLNQTFSY